MLITKSVLEFLEKEKMPFGLFRKYVIHLWSKMPDKHTDGGNDKDFFSFETLGKKFFACRNELGSLTVMFPEEY